MRFRHVYKVGKPGMIRREVGNNSVKTQYKPGFETSFCRLYASFIRYTTDYSDFLIKDKKIKSHFGGM